MNPPEALRWLLRARSILFSIAALAIPVVLLHAEGMSIAFALLLSLVSASLYAGLIYHRVKVMRARREAQPPT